jgi:hypothetical protein
MRKMVLIALVATFLATLLWRIYLDVSYAATLPAAPNPATGNVNSLVVQHGTRVFATDADMERLHRSDIAFWGGAAAGATAGVINVLQRNRRDKGPRTS